MGAHRMLKSRRAVVGALLLGLMAVWILSALILTNERQQVATGIGTGAVIAAIALLVILSHRGSGVVNFAAGAMVMYFAYVYLGLRSEGVLLIPPLPNPLAPIEGILHWAGWVGRLPHWPTMLKVDGGKPVGTALAFVTTLLVAAVVGLLLHLLIFRPLRHASELARAVASIGLLILFEAIIVLRFSDQPQQVPSVLASRRVHVAGVSAPLSYFEVALIVVVLATLLWGVMRFTRFGLATVAAAQKEKAVVLLGYSPNQLAGANWVIVSVIAAVIGVLASPLIGLTPTSVSFLVVPALAAALLGGMSSFGIATVAGLGLGVVQSLIFYYNARSWFPKYGHGPTAIPFPGFFDLFVLLVILVTLMLRGGALPTRGSAANVRLPRSVTPRHSVPRTAVGMSLAVIAMLCLSSAWRLALTNSVIGVVLSLSLVVLTGFVGQVSVAQLSIAGVAGFVMAKVALDWGLAFPLAPLLGILCAAHSALFVRSRRCGSGASISLSSPWRSLSSSKTLFFHLPRTAGPRMV